MIQCSIELLISNLINYSKNIINTIKNNNDNNLNLEYKTINENFYQTLK